MIVVGTVHCIRASRVIEHYLSCVHALLFTYFADLKQNIVCQKIASSCFVFSVKKRIYIYNKNSFDNYQFIADLIHFFFDTKNQRIYNVKRAY